MSWTQVAGQLGTEKIKSIAVFNGVIFVGALSGKLLRVNSISGLLEEVAGVSAGYISINDLLVFEGELYGCTGANGSSSGRLLKWNGTDAWVVAGTGARPVSILCMVEFDGTIFLGCGTSSNSAGAVLYRWDGISTLSTVGNSYSNYSGFNYSIAVFENELFVGMNPTGRIFKWDGVNTLTAVSAQLNSQVAIYSLTVLAGKLYGGTGNGGRLFEWNSADACVQVASQLGSQTRIYDVVTCGNNLYGSTYPTGSLYLWDNVNLQWVEVCSSAGEIIWRICSDNGKIYGACLNGNIYSYQLPSERSITKLFSFNNKLLLASDNLINDGLSGLRFDDNRNVLKMYNGLGSL